MNVDWILSQELMKFHPREAARILEGVAADVATSVLEQSDAKVAAAILQSMDPAWSSVCIARGSTDRIGRMLDHVPAAALARMVRRVDASERERVMSHLPEKLAGSLRTALDHREGTAAAIMDPEVAALPPDLLVADGLKRLRRFSKAAGPYVYVVDWNGVLIGVTGWDDLLRAPRRRPVSTVMRRPVYKLDARTEWTSIGEHPAWLRYHALPVVDVDGVLLGVIDARALREHEAGLESARTLALWSLAATLGKLYWDGSGALLRGFVDTVTSFPRQRD